MDCGAVCLRMVSSFHGKEMALETLRKLTHVEKDGVSMLSISKAAETIGFKALGVKVNFEDLKNELPLPAIAHWGQNHFVVVYEVLENKVILADPKTGIRKIGRVEFIENWTSQTGQNNAEGVLLLLEKNKSFEKSFPQELDAHRASKISLWSFIQNSPKLWLQIGFSSVLIAFFYFMIPFVIKEVFDGSNAVDEFSLVKTGLLAFFMFYLSIILLELIRNWLSNFVGARINVELISSYLEKFLNQPLRFFETKLKWDLLQRVYDNIELGDFLQGTFVRTFFYLLNFIVFTMVLAVFKIDLALIFVIGIVGQLLWVNLFQNRRKIARQEMYESAFLSQDVLLQMISGIQDIKLNNVEEKTRMDWEDNQAKFFLRKKSYLKIDYQQKTGLKVIALIVEVVLIYWTYKYFQEDVLSLGVLVAIFYILGQLKTPMIELFDNILKYQDLRLGLERLSELAIPGDFKAEAKDTKPLLGGDLLLKDLSYQYGDMDSLIVLNGINLEIKRGNMTAIVGVSGSGKTTLMKVLAGLYPPTKGEMLIGQVGLNDIDIKSWHEKIGFLYEDSFLFSTSIEQNIILSQQKDQNNLKLAIELAGLSKFVATLPLGINTLIGEEGIRLSKGQEQQILLARLFYKNPDVLILDEALSALDAVTTRKVLQNIKAYFKNKTIIMASHKQVFLKESDTILVLHKGRFLEQGTHEDLLFKKGAYYLFIKNDIQA